MRPWPWSGRALLGAVADDKARALTALNSALFADGVLIEVAPGAEIEQPIHLLFARAVADGPASAQHPRVLIDAGEGSSLTVIEQWLPGGVFSNGVTEVRVARGAQVQHVRLDHGNAGTYDLAELAVRQEADSRFASWSLALGDGLSRLDLRVELAGEGAHCDLLGLYLGRDRAHPDHHTHVDHAAPRTTSREVYKGILDGRSRGVFHGRIHVRPDAQQIDAQQTNRNLLLSDAAGINTKPQLEIHADDVKCSHGATIGQLDPDSLFYLRARGIPEAEARALLALGFAREVSDELPGETLPRAIEQFVLGWLPEEAA
jgi:Fe-S cluster assembly protein SufD